MLKIIRGYKMQNGFFSSIKTFFLVIFGFVFVLGIIATFTNDSTNSKNTSSLNKRPWCDYVVSDTIINNVLKGQTVRLDNGLLVDNETICDENMQYIISIKHGYVNGKVWKYSGNILQSIVEYNKLEKNGLALLFYNNGNVYKEKTYKNDKLNGISKEYRKNGSTFMEINYKNDKRNGDNLVYDDNGTLLYKASFNNDKLHNITCLNGYKATKNDYMTIQSGGIIKCVNKQN